LLRRKEGKCDCGYEGVLFAKGKCKICYNRESTKKWKAKAKKAKPIQRQPIKKQSAKRSSVLKKDRDFYETLWQTKPHFCEECGKYLGDNLRPHFFSHILTKGSHPVLRWNLDNINILCLEHHNQWEFGRRDVMTIGIKNKPIIERLLKDEQKQF
jgi:5-methylcytosine-specific restriction endonuclease McrA